MRMPSWTDSFLPGRATGHMITGVQRVKKRERVGEVGKEWMKREGREEKRERETAVSKLLLLEKEVSHDKSPTLSLEGASQETQ